MKTRLTRGRLRLRLPGTRLEVLLFLLLWLAYGLVINSGNLNAFGLQQVGVEAYVERGRFYIEGSKVPQLQVEPVGDAFLYDDHIYPAKQPGQFMAGAAVYFLLRPLGISYAGNYLLTAALVTFLTASMLIAASAVAVFRTAREFAGDDATQSWPLFAALTYGLATTAFPYTGIAYHDTLATGYLAIAFYLVVRLAKGEGEARGDGLRAAVAGLLLGLTVTTSMLPFFAAAVVALYFASLRRFRLWPVFALGGLAGIAPLLIYNQICFGHPLLLPNVAGNYDDTYFFLKWRNFLSKGDFYARMITTYTPVFWGGLLGLALYPRALRREQFVLFGIVAVLVVYILNIKSTGGCQYGPRYLLPAMPFVSLGILGFAAAARERWRAPLAATIALLCMASFFINLVGAMHGSMLCSFRVPAVVPYLSEMFGGKARSYPLAQWLLIPFGICLMLFIRELRARTRARAGGERATLRSLE